MSNKTQLQQNNIDLQSILSTVDGLPTADSVKHGLYVWKKKIFYEEYPYTLSNPTFNIVIDTSTFENFNISLSSLAKIPPDINDFLNGFELYDQQNTRRFILTYENGVMYADTQKTIIATITLSGTTLTITISNVDIWIGSTGLMKYVGDKTYYVHNVIGETVGFVVSDNSSAYPDGGVQDGYWYEKVSEGIDLSALGCTKAVTEKITPSSRTQKIYHSLGITPKIVIVTTESTTVGQYDTQGFIVAPFSLKTTAIKILLGCTYEYYSGANVINNSNVEFLTSKYINVGPYFTAGVEYIVTTIG